MAVAAKGILFEYGLSLPPLALIFDFNPQQISRSVSATIKTGNAPGARLGEHVHQGSARVEAGDQGDGQAPAAHERGPQRDAARSTDVHEIPPRVDIRATYRS